VGAFVCVENHDQILQTENPTGLYRNGFHFSPLLKQIFNILLNKSRRRGFSARVFGLLGAGQLQMALVPNDLR